MSIFLTEKRRLTGDLGVLNEKNPTEGIPVGENAVLGVGFGAVCRECRGSANRELGIISQEISADLPVQIGSIARKDFLYGRIWLLKMDLAELGSLALDNLV